MAVSTGRCCVGSQNNIDVNETMQYFVNTIGFEKHQVMATVAEQAWRSHYHSMSSHLLQSRQHYVEPFIAVEFGTVVGGTCRTSDGFCYTIHIDKKKEWS